MTPISNVRIGKHAFVAGLTWVPLTRPRDLKGEAKTLLGKYGCDAYVIVHRMGTAQVGLGNVSAGCKSGMLTLAGAVADNVAGSSFNVGGRTQRLQDWIGVFELPNNQWFLIAVRDGSIIPNCDRIGSYDEIYELLEQTYGICGWSAVIGSASLPSQSSYHNFTPLSIEAALGLKNESITKPARFALHVKGDHKAVLIAGAIGVLSLALAGAGWHLYQQYRLEVEAAELAALQAQMGQANQPVGAKQILEVPREWVTMPTPASLVLACMGHLDMPASPGTWTLGGFDCSPTDSTVHLTRNDQTTVGYLKELLPAAVVSPTQNEATWKRPFGEMLSADEPLAVWNEIDTALFAKMQTLKVSYMVGVPTSPTVPELTPEDAAKFEYAPADWLIRTFSVGPTPIMPPSLVEALSVPGMRIKSVKYKDGQWTYEGNIYAK